MQYSDMSLRHNHLHLNLIPTSLVKDISTLLTKHVLQKTLIGYFILLPRYALPYFKHKRSLMYRILAYPLYYVSGCYKVLCDWTQD